MNFHVFSRTSIVCPPLQLKIITRRFLYTWFLSAELSSVQGKTVDIGDYYRPDGKLAAKAMRPSATFNAALETL
jgi:hypothetical protein